MSVNQKKNLQFLRSQAVYDTKEAAKAALTGLTFDNATYDGTPAVARYKIGDEVKSILAIYHDENGTAVPTFFENADEMDAVITDLQEALGAETADEVKAELSGTTYAKGEDVDNLIDAIKELDDEIVANEVTSDDKTVVVTKATSGTNVSVNIDSATIVKTELGVLSADKSLLYVPANESSVSGAYITLVNAVDEEEGEKIMVADLIGNGMLKSASYDKTTGILTLVFATASGEDEEVEIDLKEMLDIDDVVIGDDSKDYLKVTLGASGETGENMILDVKLGEVSVGVDAETSAMTISGSVGIANAEEVAEALADVAEVLEAEIAELSANSLTGISVNGIEAEYDVEGDTTHVAVVVKGENIEVASAYTEVEFAEEFAEKLGENATVAADDTIDAAFAKVENEVKVLVDEVLANEETTEKAIEALATAAGVSNAEGEIAYTVHEAYTILSAATNLDSADVALANEIRKVEAKSSTIVVANEEAGNVKPAEGTAGLGAAVTSTVDEATKATTYSVDVNFDFGQF